MSSKQPPKKRKKRRVPDENDPWRKPTNPYRRKRIPEQE